MVGEAVCAVLVFANVVFCVRSIWIARRSREQIRACEAVGDFPMLSIIVPARNEERQIETCVRSLLAQRHANLEVLVVDDQSEDATHAIIERLQRDDTRLRCIVGAPLPEGWVGKPWALAQGAQASRGDWMLFTDADTVHDPDAAGSALVHAVRHHLDALSLLTEQEMIGPSERIFLPSILWIIAFAVGAIEDVNNPAKPNAIFNGQFVLMSRGCYEAFGGYAVLKNEIAEDLELARLLKQDGRFRTALLGANALVRTRMYRSFAELWRGFVKNFALGAHGQWHLAAFGLLFLACISPLTPVALIAFAVSGHVGLAWAMAAAMLLAILGAEYGMRHSHFPAGSGWTLPAGIAMLLAIFATSLVRFASGVGVDWRGRHYGRR